MSAGIDCFPQLSRDDIRFISDYGVTRQYPKHSIVIHEGDDGDSLWVILEGKVKIFVSDEHGKEVILNIQGPFEYFGELALIDQAPRSASVMTTEPTRLALVSRSDFRSCLIDEPAIALKLISSLTQRVRILTYFVKDLALHSVRERVIHVLLKLAIEQKGKMTVNQRLTHQDIADMVGSSREMVSRIMKDLMTDGYIEARQKIITIERKLLCQR